MLNMYQIVDIGNGQINQDYNAAKNKDKSQIYMACNDFFFFYIQMCLKELLKELFCPK